MGAAVTTQADPFRRLYDANYGRLTDEKIAETLGISLGNAKVRLHRARREFRKIIAARCDFYRNELSCTPATPGCCGPSPPPGGSATGH